MKLKIGYHWRYDDDGNPHLVGIVLCSVTKRDPMNRLFEIPVPVFIARRIEHGTD